MIRFALLPVLLCALLAGCNRSSSPPAPASAAPVPAAASAAAPAKLDPARKQALAAEGQAAYDAKDWATCADRFAQIADHYNAACCFSQAGKLDQAFAEFERATEGPDAFRDVAHVQKDPDLTALRADARWPAAFARVEVARAAWIAGAGLNAELLTIFEADQGDRTGGHAAIDWSQVAPRDQARRKRVTEIVAAGGAKAAADWYHAAMVFQHGETVADIETARDYAAKAVALDATHKQARWLVAAATDRVLTYQGKPQKYGTQYKKQDGVWILEPVAPETTDEERARWGVPPLAEAQRRAAQMNATDGH